MNFHFRRIQDLNTVLRASPIFTWGNYDPPPIDPVTGRPRVPDPSTPGPPTSWPPVIYDPFTDPPNTTTYSPPTYPPTSREGGGVPPGGATARPPRRVREGGTPRPPTPGIVTHADADPGPHRCFAGLVRFRVSANGPDPFGYDGQQPQFFGTMCAPYNPPYAAGPTTGLVTRIITTSSTGLSFGVIPYGTTLLDAMAIWLSHNVGSAATAEVISDRIGIPGNACQISLGSPQACDTSMGGVTSSLNNDTSVAGTGVGIVVGAA